LVLSEDNSADSGDESGAGPWLRGPFQLLFVVLLVLAAALAAYFLLVG